LGGISGGFWREGVNFGGGDIDIAAMTFIAHSFLHAGGYLAVGKKNHVIDMEGYVATATADGFGTDLGVAV
jgi:hypothetical protein